jgi:hypothetical protein
MGFCPSKLFTKGEWNGQQGKLRSEVHGEGSDRKGKMPKL